MNSGGTGRGEVAGERRVNRRQWHTTALLGVCIAACAGLLLRAFVVSAIRVPSGSMEDTVLPGDHVLVNKLVVPRRLLVQFPFVPLSPVTLVIPAVRSLRLGDVLVVRPPALVALGLLPRDAYILKRCVGLPGDTLTFEGFLLRVNGRVVSLPPTAKQARSPRLLTETGTPYTIIVPQGSYFMMGDNPGRSEDSRVWGPVPHDAIVGSAAIVYWSVAPAAPGISPESGHTSVRWDRIGVLIR